MGVLRLLELAAAGGAVAILYLVVVRALLSESAASRIPLPAAIVGFILGSAAALVAVWLLAERDPAVLPVAVAGFALARAALSRTFCGVDEAEAAEDERSAEEAVLVTRNAEVHG